MAKTNERLFTREQAAERLGISLSTLDAEKKSGNLGYIQRKRRGKVWITEQHIQDYLNQWNHDRKRRK